MKKWLIVGCACSLLLGVAAGYFLLHRPRPGPTEVKIDSTVAASGHLPSDDPAIIKGKVKIASLEDENIGGSMNSRIGLVPSKNPYLVPLNGTEKATWESSGNSGEVTRQVTGTGALTVNDDLSLDLSVDLQGDPFKIEVSAEPLRAKWKVGAGVTGEVDQSLEAEWFAYAKVIKPIYVGQHIEINPSVAVGYGSDGVQLTLGAEAYWSIY